MIRIAWGAPDFDALDAEGAVEEEELALKTERSYARPVPDLDLRAGALVGDRYEIRDVLGQGPTGTVYRALDEEVEIEVALKVISDEVLPDADARARFLQSLARAEQIVHPNIVRYFDLGVHEDRCYLAAQLCEGLTLRKLLEMRHNKGEVFGLLEAEPIVAQIARGLSALHRLGIVCGALRPENVIVLPSGVKIADVALWRSFVPAQLEHVIAAAQAEPYVAPEVVRGEAVDARADTYSLATVVEEMLGGREAMPAALAEVIAQARSQHIEDRPSVTELAEDVGAVAHTGARRPRPLPVVMRMPDPQPRAPSPFEGTQQLDESDLIESSLPDSRGLDARAVLEGERTIRMENERTLRMRPDELARMITTAREGTEQVEEEELLLLREQSARVSQRADVGDLMVAADSSRIVEIEESGEAELASEMTRMPGASAVAYDFDRTPYDRQGGAPAPEPMAQLGERVAAMLDGDLQGHSSHEPLGHHALGHHPMPAHDNGTTHPESREEPHRALPHEPKVIFDSGKLTPQTTSRFPGGSSLETVRVPPLSPPLRTPPVGAGRVTTPAFVAALLIVVCVSVTVATLFYLARRDSQRGGPHAGARVTQGRTPVPPALADGAAKLKTVGAWSPFSLGGVAAAGAAENEVREDGCPLGSKRHRAGRHDFCVESYEYPGGRVIPRTKIGWADADRACHSRGARLCTRAEWLASCRGARNAEYPYGTSADPSRCNVAGTVQPAGSFALCKSPAGAFDMVGNVAEWVSERVALGGSAATGDADEARCSVERKVDLHAGSDDVGFRCCVDAK